MCEGEFVWQKVGSHSFYFDIFRKRCQLVTKQRHHLCIEKMSRWNVFLWKVKLWVSQTVQEENGKKAKHGVSLTEDSKISLVLRKQGGKGEVSGTRQMKVINEYTCSG